jgi:hypothetical protein
MNGIKTKKMSPFVLHIVYNQLREQSRKAKNSNVRPILKIYNLDWMLPDCKDLPFY